MAAWGSLMNILDNPSSDSLSSWSQLLPKAETKPDDNVFEIFGELYYKTKPETETEGLGYLESAAVDKYTSSYLDVRSRSSDGRSVYPPPITSIGRCGRPRVYFNSYRKDGRFVLRKFKIPTQQLLQSTRENGRLRMQVAAPEEDDEETAEGGEGRQRPRR